MDKFPTRIDKITTRWLTQVLQSNNKLVDGVVSQFSVEQISGGYTASVYRLVLEYTPLIVGSPKSLVVKFHGDSPITREVFENIGAYEKEVLFYQHLAYDDSIPAPACYSKEFDSKSGEFILLMEDLSAGRPGSCSTDALSDIRIALPYLARIHGNFWGGKRLNQHKWIEQPSDLKKPTLLRDLWIFNLGYVKQNYQDQLSNYAWSVCQKWTLFWDEIMLCMNLDDHTLVHTDPHLGQMFFPTDEFQRFVLFDWQYPCQAWGAEDVVHLIVSELGISSRRSNENALINLYFERLCQHGITSLTKERFWFQCKLSLLWLYFMYFNNVAQPGMFKALKSDAEELGENWQDWIFLKLDATTKDWQLDDILDQAIQQSGYRI